MYFKLLYVFIFIISYSFGQTFHSRNMLISSETMIMSAKGNAMGNTGMMVDDNAFWTFSNPAALSGLQDVSISFKGSMNRYKEHRSIKVHDYFGDFLADASYVFNNDNNFYNGIAISSPIFYNNLVIGLSNLPFHNFNYNYVEEVHDASFDLNKDPLVGYHIQKTSGLLYALSFGFGAKIKDYPLLIFDNLSFGFSYNRIHSGNIFSNSSIIIDKIKSVVVLAESDNLASDESYADTSIINLESRDFINYGLKTNLYKNIVFSINCREEINTIDKNSLAYVIPEKISMGIMLNPRQEIPASIVFGYDIQNYSSIDSIFNNKVNLYDKKTYHFGIEYINIESAIRAGMIYQNSPFQRDLDESIFTFGYGKSINQLLIDIAVHYSNISYSYLDQFIPDGDISNPDQYEKISESNIGFSISLSYNLK